jgi:hypothetical protein
MVLGSPPCRCGPGAREWYVERAGCDRCVLGVGAGRGVARRSARTPCRRGSVRAAVRAEIRRRRRRPAGHHLRADCWRRVTTVRRLRRPVRRPGTGSVGEARWPGIRCIPVTRQVRKRPALASADDRTHDQFVVARASGGSWFSLSRSQWLVRSGTRAGPRTCGTTLARSARTASRPAASVSGPASRPVRTVHALVLAGAGSKKNCTYGASGRFYAALCSIGPTAVHHTGHTGRDGPFRSLSSRPEEDAASHQERRAWDIWNLAIFLRVRPGSGPPHSTRSTGKPAPRSH